jgi:acetyl-CoA carboxylase carboxyltransferase component
LLYAYADATVPKLTVITGQALNDAFIALASSRRDADLTLAWPTADVGGVAEADGDGHHPALERGLVDDVIEPGETRRALLRALELCLTKITPEVDRRHGNSP